MEELIQKLQNEHGLSADQSHGILNTIAGYIKEKFPMFGGAIDNIFPSGAASSSLGANTVDTEPDVAATPKGDGSFLDKISDYVPGSTGEKIEEFAKDKLGGFFGKK